MSQRPPSRKVVLAYLLVGIIIVALVSFLLGGGGLFRIARLVLLYGATFLVLLYILQSARRRR